jgi:hypothetical protein
MASNLQTGSEPSMTGLVTGIVHDIQDLLQKQLNLFKHEVSRDFTKGKEATLFLLLGTGVLSVGFWLLCVMVVYLLHWAMELPLWGCFAIVGGVSAILGAVLLSIGITKLKAFTPVPEESAQELKENLQCLMNPK